MIIDNCDFFCSLWCPDEGDAPLSVDADGVVAFEVAFERFESVVRWYFEVLESGGLV